VNNVRDKLIIIGVIIIALGDMALMAFRGFQGETIIRDVLLLLGTAFKGIPSPRSSAMTEVGSPPDPVLPPRQSSSKEPGAPHA